MATTQPVNEATLLYVRSGVDLAVMPGSESGVMFGSDAAGRVSSNEVFVAGTSLLAAHAFGHEAERLSQIEQVFVAALETGRIDDAAIRLNDLEKEFPTTTNKDGNIVFASLRVAKLQGMLLEAKAEFDKALALYEKALAQDETYAPIIKRKVAVLIDQGKSNVAITTLVHYLDHFHADLEAWTTLSNLYLRANMFQQAAFALEECMILGGFNFLYHIRYAELNMTLGKYPVALKYFCSAVEVTETGGGSLRAWYGLRQVTRVLLDQPAQDVKSPVNNKKSNTVAAVAAADSSVDIPSPEDLKLLNKLAGDKIEAIYKEKKAPSENIEVVKSWLQTV